MGKQCLGKACSWRSPPLKQLTSLLTGEAGTLLSFASTFQGLWHVPNLFLPQGGSSNWTVILGFLRTSNGPSYFRMRRWSLCLLNQIFFAFSLMRTWCPARNSRGCCFLLAYFFIIPFEANQYGLKVTHLWEMCNEIHRNTLSRSRRDRQGFEKPTLTALSGATPLCHIVAQPSYSPSQDLNFSCIILLTWSCGQ